MVRRLVVSGIGVGFQIPENLAWDLAGKRLAWTALADAKGQTFNGLYQRRGQTTAVAMGMFLELLETEILAVQERFGAAAPCTQ